MLTELFVGISGDTSILNAQLNILAGTPVQTATQSMYDRLSATYGMLVR